MHKLPDRTGFAARKARFKRNVSLAHQDGGRFRRENQGRESDGGRQAEFGYGDGEEYRGKTKKPNQHNVSAEFGYE